MKEKINLTVTSADGSPVEVHLREGQLPDIVQQLRAPIHIEGTIAAPADWYEKKLDNDLTIDTSAVVVEFSHDERSIVLTVGDHLERPHAVIKGVLKLTKELLGFQINTGKKWGPIELARHIKMNRRFFADRATSLELVNKLTALTVTADQALTVRDNGRGARGRGFEQHLRFDLPEDVKLSVPIFKGQSAREFLVDICVDKTDTDVYIQLESAELAEVIELGTSEAIHNQLARFDEQGLTVVQLD